MSEPIITSVVRTERQITVHMIARDKAGFYLPPSYRTTACGRTLPRNVVDEKVEHVNCKSCLRVIR